MYICLAYQLQICQPFPPYLQKLLVIPNLNPSAITNTNMQGPDFDDMSSFFPCQIDNAIQNINLGYGTQAPKIVIL